MNIKVLIHAEDGGYWAEVPNMKGCVSEGDTIEEVLANIKEAIELWLSVDIPVKNCPPNCEVMSVAI